MGSIMNGGGGGTLISGAGTLINVKNVGKTMTWESARRQWENHRCRNENFAWEKWQ